MGLCTTRGFPLTVYTYILYNSNLLYGREFKTNL